MKKSMRLMSQIYSLLLLIGVIFCMSSSLMADDLQDFTFDDSLLLGGGYGDSYLSRFNSTAETIPGQYQVDIYINGTYLNREIINFIKVDSQGVVPCLDLNFWKKSNVTAIYINEDALLQAECAAPDTVVKGVSTQFDAEKLRLGIAIPQAYLRQIPRGYVDPSSWSEGENAGFISYNSNYYQTNSRSAGSDMRAIYTGLNSGVNLGLWRLRNQSSYQYNDVGQNTQESFNSIRTYITRALPDMQSELLLGDAYTRGNIFGSLAFTGVQLLTDNRMLPESQRGYAPVVRGLANSTASVVIKQNGVSIYQTTVAAGPFVINDLFPTSYEGDLLVEISEADGKVSSFTVPFSAVPGSLREGSFQYGLSFGEVDQAESGGYFVDLISEYGLSNMLTLNSGGRVGDDYFALSLGTVLGTEWGALGLTAVHSMSRISQSSVFNEWKNGWRVGLNYSHSFDSGTSVALAGYHYSTESFRELNDVLGLRRALESGNIFESETYRQRSEMSLSVNQSLDDFGFVYLSGSKRQYRDGRDDDDQLQFGYSVGIGRVNIGLTFSRQYTSQVPLQNGFSGQLLTEMSGYSSDRVKEDLVSLTVSIPFGRRQSNMLSSGFSHSSRGNEQYNLGLAGTVDDDNTWTYGLNASLQRQDSSSESVSVNTQKRFSQATLSGNYSISDTYQQVGAGLSGAAVVHSGGITLSQNLSDTFAIVQAEGASGAKVTNNWGTEIDGLGYAIIPSLTPYRSNSVTLDSGSMLSSTELIDTQQQVAPYAGSIVKIKFETRHGIAVVFMTQQANGGVIPIGAEVLDEDGVVLGMVGQAGMAYVRAPKPSGQLTVNWGNKSDQQCHFNYALENSRDNTLLRMPALCERVN